MAAIKLVTVYIFLKVSFKMVVFLFFLGSRGGDGYGILQGCYDTFDTYISYYPYTTR